MHRGDTKVTRIKMHQPSFDALRIALQDSDARVRIEDQIPVSVPYVLGVSFDGGFLHEQAMHFQPQPQLHHRWARYWKIDRLRSDQMPEWTAKRQ